MKQLFLFLLVVIILVIYSTFFIFDKETIIFLSREDGIIEIFGAISLLGAAICFFVYYLKEKIGNNFYILRFKKNIFFILLTVIFFFGFGEEISWGQRILHFNTPESIKTINMQQELNIHNISYFHAVDKGGKLKSSLKLLINFDRIFSLFWLFFAFLIPLTYRLSSSLKQFYQRINIPIVPLWLGIFFIFNYTIAKMLVFFIGNQDYLIRSITECKESIYEFLFFLIGIYFLVHKSKMKVLNEFN